MKFNINNYKGKYVMHCNTEEEAKDFCKYLKNTENITVTLSLWCISGKFVYYFNKGTWGDKNSAIDNGYTVLEWSYFTKSFTKADLKTGDVILRRNGDVEIVNGELKMFIRKNGWTGFDGIHDDLTASYGRDGWDIMSVRRPKEQSDCQFNAFELEFGTLVYEREEVEEMTLAEVCKLLGKNIKIVK